MDRKPVNIKFGGSDAFYRTLKARVERYFRLTGRSPHDHPQIYVKTGVLFATLAASYILLVFFASAWWIGVPLAVILGLSMAGIGFNVQHDGAHKAFSRHRWINKLAAMSLELLGGSSYRWDHKHNTIHHTYANIVEHDNDIDVGFFGRLAPEQRRLWFHRVQHFYLWFLYGFLPMKWQLIDDFSDVAKGRIGSHKFARPKNTDLLIFIGGKVVFFSLAFVIPMLLHPFWEVLLFYGLACWINGIVISVIFQLAHVVEQAQFPVPDHATGRMNSHWAVHQVQTTVDFAPRNRVLSWMVGGLNYQIEHHLFPRICHIHYPQISRLVENACRRHGLPYNSHATLFAGLTSHFRWLRRMGLAKG